MAKCIRCGRGGMGVLHSAIKLKGGVRICFRCYKELGFDPLQDLSLAHLLYSWDDIKDGREEMDARRMSDLIDRTNRDEALRFGLSPAHYKQLAAAGATPQEMRIMSVLCNVLVDEGCDPSALDVAPGSNGSLIVMVDGVAFIQYKSDSGVKWIILPNESGEKIRIAGPARLNTLALRLAAAYRAASE